MSAKNAPQYFPSFGPADEGYPSNLLTVTNHPERLWIRGTLLPRDQRSIAIVGSRACSHQGVLRTARLARELVGLGFTIVSGLAKGIDAAAHQAALDAGGRTIAVVGTGLGTVYPAENRDLHDQIAEQGAIVSQFPPSFRGMRGGRNFLMRNVTMSGLALATVVIEASERSGSRSHANSAVAHGRPVFLLRSLVSSQLWAAQMAQLPGVHVVDHVEDIIGVLAGALEETAALAGPRLLQGEKKRAAPPLATPAGVA